MKAILFSGLFVSLLFLFSCLNKYDIIKETLPKGSIKLNFNVQKQVNNNLLLELIAINDSRCPVGAICSAAGKVSLDIRVVSNEISETATLFFSEIPNTVQNIDTVAGYRIEIIEVSPMPYLNKPIESDSLYSVYLLAKEI